MPQIALSSDFLEAYAKIPKSQQKKVRAFAEKFCLDPTQASIHYESIHDTRDDKVRTVRIGRDYRAVVVHPPKGDVYLLVHVDHHDEAMAWAKNKVFGVNPRVGSFQVYEVEEATAPAEPTEAPLEVTYEEPDRIPEGRLLSGFSDGELLVVGVPELLVPSVRALRTEQDLDELAPYLPDDAADALYWLAAGGTIQEALVEAERAREPEAPVDVEDFETALRKPESAQRFALVGDQDYDLAEMLEAPLAQWRVFLHPNQRRLVTRDVSGPVRVLGGAGTGKTVVLIHRARHLAANVFDGQADRILVTTFTRNLANDLQDMLEQICGDELDRIEVANLHLWAVRFMRSQGIAFNIANAQKQRQLWQRAFDEAERAGRPLAFYQEEWDKIVLSHGILERDHYFRISRRGRGTGLNRRQRAEVWRVLARYRSLLQEENLVEWPDVIRETRLYLERNPGTLPYRAVLADEVQDFRTIDLLLLRTLVPPDRNDIFVVGDAHQRIYGHRQSLTKCGIKIRGRARRLRVNYRTTEKIRNWSVALLEGLAVDDLDEGLDTLKGYRSLRVGVEPEVRLFDTAAQERDFIVARLSQWLEVTRPESICLAVRKRSLIEARYQPILDSHGIDWAVIEQDAESGLGKGVRLATMHRLKGLEFERVLLASVNDGVMPARLAAHQAADKTSRADHLQGERHLLFVAATRARDELVVTGFGKPSAFLRTEAFADPGSG